MIQRIEFEALGRVGLQIADDPASVGATEILVRTSLLGICGTDLHVLHGKHPWVKPPLITGHEMAGTVEQVGSSVIGFRPGDAVVLNPLVHCGQCRRCLRGSFNTCENAKVIGFRLPGAAQTKLVVGQAQLRPVPAGLPLERAVLAEPLAVGVHAAGLWDDLEDVLVIGGGTIGLCVVAALKARGAGRVTVIEPVASKRSLALRLGADVAVEPDTIAPTPCFTATFDIVAAQATIDLGGAATLSGGAIVVVGVAPSGMILPLPRMQRFEITLKGSGMYLDEDIDAALGLLASGAVDADAFVTGVYPLAEATRAYAGAEQADAVKTVIRFDG